MIGFARVFAFAAAAVLAPSAITRANDEPPPPLTPRYPTPTEDAEDAARPPFALPTRPAAERVEPTAATEPVSRAGRVRAPYHPPALLARAQGGRRSWRGEAFLERPRELSRLALTWSEAKRNAGRGLVYVRGFYSYLSGGHAEWSGTDVTTYVDLAEGFSASALFHHEYRETRGAFGLASLAIRVLPEIYLTSTVAAGNGVDYLPITSLDLELSAPLPRTCRLRYAVAAGTSWWAYEQREVQLGGAVRAQLPLALVGELRGEASVIDAPDADAHVGLRGIATLARGQHGARVYQLRASIGDEPAYRPGAQLAARRDRLTIDVGAGVRGWVRRRYGYLVQVEGGWQDAGPTRIGGDLTVFLEF